MDEDDLGSEAADAWKVCHGELLGEISCDDLVRQGMIDIYGRVCMQLKLTVLL